MKKRYRFPFGPRYKDEQDKQNYKNEMSLAKSQVFHDLTHPFSPWIKGRSGEKWDKRIVNLEWLLIVLVSVNAALGSSFLVFLLKLPLVCLLCMSFFAFINLLLNTFGCYVKGIPYISHDSERKENGNTNVKESKNENHEKV